MPVWRGSASPDPLRAGALPFDVALADLPVPGQWTASLELAYANTWSVSPDVTGLHRELGRERQEVSDAELTELHRRRPDGPTWLVDVEGWRSDLRAALGLTPDLAVVAHVPWLQVGQPRWDGVSEWWHRVTGLPNADRDAFPRGRTAVVLAGPGRSVQRRDLEGSGLGDLSLALAARVGRALGGEHRAVLAVQAPTGERDTLLGSGGLDLGVRWLGLWERRRASLLAGAGWTRLDRSGSFLGLERADQWHLLGGLDWRLFGVTVSLRSLYERSPLAGVLDGRPSRPAWSNRFGLASDLGKGLWGAFEMSQDSASGLSPDFAFHLTLGVSPPRR